ncbi:MAG: DUF5069 domain-containing protein [Candidatus Eremiobacteraeota bacterium]|nr:DUF5069 domain-containing protein [Candidatus Eremiobacteraeota bacterium]
MDLTKEYPRSVHHKMRGVVQLARTTDKAKATAHGNVGEYHYNCPMDKAVFEFLGIDHEQYLKLVKNAKSDDEIEQYAKQFIDKKSPYQLEEWNRKWVSTVPVGESLAYLTELRKNIAPDRDDVTTWADVLDLDEGRDVPRRIAA